MAEQQIENWKIPSIFQVNVLNFHFTLHIFEPIYFC